LLYHVDGRPGVKGGIVYGEMGDFPYNIVNDPAHVRDFQATILHQVKRILA
jgi:hypothetical protein